jgi:glycosyltransferase involved in cell wall biosynthesis
MNEVAVVVGTYGDKEIWGPLADRAVLSVEKQTVKASVIWSHGETLQAARNNGARLTRSNWLVFLDADDTLDPGYVEGILAGTGDVRQPMTLGVYDDGHEDDYPVLIPRKKSFADGNWIVIGAGVRRELFENVGGFLDEPYAEDWSLWWRCQKAGGKIGIAPRAIYRVSVNPAGRNEPDRAFKEHWFKTIADRYRT